VRISTAFVLRLIKVVPFLVPFGSLLATLENFCDPNLTSLNPTCTVFVDYISVFCSVCICFLSDFFPSDVQSVFLYYAYYLRRPTCLTISTYCKAASCGASGNSCRSLAGNT
jgi:hypothetical protein